MKDGRFHAIEVKREIGGTESEDQKRFGANVRAAGGAYAVVRSVEEVEAFLGPIGPRVQKVKHERVIHR